MLSFLVCQYGILYHFAGIQITFCEKKFGKPIKISYSRKYIKRDVLFWELMDNVSFQTTLFLCIWSMFFAQSNSISPGYISFSLFFILLFPLHFPLPLPFSFPWPFSLLSPYTSFSALLIPSSKRFSIVGFTATRYSWRLAQVNLIVHHHNLIHFLNFLPKQIQCPKCFVDCQYHLPCHYLLYPTMQIFHHFQFLYLS